MFYFTANSVINKSDIWVAMFRDGLETLLLTPLEPSEEGSQKKSEGLAFDVQLESESKTNSGVGDEANRRWMVDIGGPEVVEAELDKGEVKPQQIRDEEKLGFEENWLAPRGARTGDYQVRHGRIVPRHDAHTGRRRGAHLEPSKYLHRGALGNWVQGRKYSYPERKYTSIDDGDLSGREGIYSRSKNTSYGREKAETENSRIELAQEGLENGWDALWEELDDLEYGTNSRLRGELPEKNKDQTVETDESTDDFEAVETDEWVVLGRREYRQEPIIGIAEAQRIEGEERKQRSYLAMMAQGWKKK